MTTPTIPIPWTTPVGAMLTREERMQQYGGGRYGGIEPAPASANVFVYSDPSRGAAYGYSFDGWDPDNEIFLYTGEGRIGDQVMKEGNKAIFNQRTDGRTLRVFVADGTIPGTNTRRHRYLGEFRVDEQVPYTEEIASDVNGDDRKVFVFRLRPASDDYLVRPTDRSDLSDETAQSEAELVPLEGSIDDVYTVPAVSPRIAQKRERQLVEAYKEFLKAQGHDAESRWRLKLSNQLVPMHTDVYDKTGNELYEAKGTATRNDVRMAIGQLLDYRRHISTNPKLTVLLPERPSADVTALIHSVGFSCVYQYAPGVFGRRDPSDEGEP
ncbi:hypothetical protein [Dactylosporangium sp. NPDC051484]|uniref:hypothetical protein n=1 Tax=Dactylosporangium sp. NPDC051484 TaxID=3154942 RepID=UPI00344B77DE